MSTQILQPPSVLLMGASGSGKTYSLSSLLEAGLEVFVISTEPHGMESLIDAVHKKNLDISKLHWTYIQPARPGFEGLEASSKKIEIMDQKSLADMRPGARQDSQYTKLLRAFNNFTDDKDGKSYGSVSQFGADRCVVVDSLSGVSAMAMDIVIGDKVTANPGEWGIAMRNLDKFMLTCTSDLKCFFVMLAHIEKEEDLVTGVSKIMVSTLGKKLAPQIPKFFSEVVLAEVDTTGDDKQTFRWSTNTANHVLKSRSLPVSSKLQPSFLPIVEAYKSRLTQLAKS